MIKSRILKVLFAVVVFVGLLGLWTVPAHAADFDGWPNYSGVVGDGDVLIIQSPTGQITLYTADDIVLSKTILKGYVADVTLKYNYKIAVYNVTSKNWVINQSGGSSDKTSLHIYGNGPSGISGTQYIYSNFFTMTDLEKIYASSVASGGESYANATGNLDNIVFHRPLLTPHQAETLLGAPVVESLGAIRGLMICLVALVAGLVVLPTVLRAFRAR